MAVTYRRHSSNNWDGFPCPEEGEDGETSVWGSFAAKRPKVSRKFGKMFVFCQDSEYGDEVTWCCFARVDGGDEIPVVLEHRGAGCSYIQDGGLGELYVRIHPDCTYEETRQIYDDLERQFSVE